MKFYFKAEANSKIGGGHLHRCISLAKELIKKNIEVSFIFSNTPQQVVEKTKENGFNTFQINPENQFNSKTYLEIIPTNSLLIFDTDDPHFYDGELIRNLNQNILTGCFTITDQYRISTNIIINPNIISLSQRYNSPKNTIEILGPDYFIFKEEFRSLSFNRRAVNPLSKQMLVFFGNSDVKHLSLVFLRTLLTNSLPNDIEYHLVIGDLNPDINKIKQISDLIPESVLKLHINIKSLIYLYKNTDFAFTSAGMTMWEMALFEIPQLVIPTSVREIQYAKYLAEKKYINLVNNMSDLSTEMVSSNINKFIHNDSISLIETSKFKNIINPNGIQSLVENLIEIVSNNSNLANQN